MSHKLLSLARDIAKEEARRFRFNYGYGFQVVEPDDLAVEALTRLMESGHDLEAGVQPDGRPIDNLPAYLRTTIRNVGFAMARRATRDVQADFDESSEEWGWLHDSETHASDWGNPEAEVIAGVDTLLDDARLALEALVEQLPHWRQKKVARAYYLDGREAKDIAEAFRLSHQVVRHTLSAARKALGTHEANLRAWREAIFPESRRPKSDSAQGSPDILKAIVSSRL